MTMLTTGITTRSAVRNPAEAVQARPAAGDDDVDVINHLEHFKDKRTLRVIDELDDILWQTVGIQRLLDGTHFNDLNSLRIRFALSQSFRHDGCSETQLLRFS